MNLNNLYYFVVVAEELNFTRSANRLHVSQQAISSHVKKLEEEFNVVLFHRKPTLSLTPAGVSFYHIAMEILQLQQKFYMDTKYMLSEQTVNIALGLAYGRSRIIGPEIISEINRRYPNIQLQIKEKATTAILEQSLLLNEIDFFIGLTPIRSPQIKTLPLSTESLLLIVPNAFMKKLSLPLPTARLTSPATVSQSGGVSLSCFRDFPFLLPSQDNILRFTFNQYAESLNFIPNVIFESSQVDTLFSMAMDGMGLTIYPRTLMNYQKKHMSADCLAGISAFELSECIHSKIVIGYSEFRRLTSSEYVFIDLLQQIPYFN